VFWEVANDARIVNVKVGCADFKRGSGGSKCIGSRLSIEVALLDSSDGNFFVSFGERALAPAALSQE
jgi:hypothetical protein